jgi:hypothetical protein
MSSELKLGLQYVDTLQKLAQLPRRPGDDSNELSNVAPLSFPSGQDYYATELSRFKNK